MIDYLRILVDPPCATFVAVVLISTELSVEFTSVVVQSDLPQNEQPVSDYRKVLLVGATGYVF